MVGQFMTNWFWSSILEENDDNNLKDTALTLNAFFPVKFCISETWTEFGWNKKNYSKIFQGFQAHLSSKVNLEVIFSFFNVC